MALPWNQDAFRAERDPLLAAVVERAPGDVEPFGQRSLQPVRGAPSGQGRATARQSRHRRCGEPPLALAQRILSARQLLDGAQSGQVGCHTSQPLGATAHQGRQQLENARPLRAQATYQ